MEFRDIKYVLKVAEEKSISKAAQKLFVTQPSLSQSIGRIENSLGVQLFDRSKKPLILSFAGKQFVKTAYYIMNYEKQLSRQMKDIADLKNGHITLGISQFRGKYFLPKVLPAFYKEYPGITVSIHEDQAAELETAILAGDLDFSIEILPVKSKELISSVISEEQHLLVLPKEHRLNNRKRIVDNAQYPFLDVSELKNETFIYLKADSPSRVQLTKFFKKSNFVPKNVIEIKDMETAHALAVAGLGVAFISELLIPYCNSAHRGVYYRLKDCVPDKLQVGFVYKKNSYHSKAVKAFFALVSEVF
ncbi:LysR family transcriptional regulator [Pectinatus frisingensis]|uniref:LysR family transcriptional regulator n=1 Tax=Pectinatus frisingensis TaxID=865 RepID=UPI0018C73D28|nr:LysR family transcriptional regulator [Pectinatus frisingensis]